MSVQAPPTERAPIGRTLAVARPVGGRLTLATVLGAASAAAGIALLATSGWLISRAAEQPSIVALGVAIVGVRFFALSKGLFLVSTQYFFSTNRTMSCTRKTQRST